MPAILGVEYKIWIFGYDVYRFKAPVQSLGDIMIIWENESLKINCCSMGQIDGFS